MMKIFLILISIVMMGCASSSSNTDYSHFNPIDETYTYSFISDTGIKFYVKPRGQKSGIYEFSLNVGREDKMKHCGLTTNSDICKGPVYKAKKFKVCPDQIYLGAVNNLSIYGDAWVYCSPSAAKAIEYKMINGPKPNIYDDFKSNYEDYTLEKTIVVNALTINVRNMYVDENIFKGCEGKYQFMEFIGPMNDDTSEVFRRLLEQTPTCKDKNGETIPVWVSMSSGGGYLRDGFKVGNLFRENNVNTIINKDELCASSCATAFMGGKERVILNTGQIMFHAPYSFNKNALKNGQARIKCQFNNSDLRNYLVLMMNKADGDFLYKRNMSYCSTSSGWLLNKDAADLFKVTTS
jgi:hypothetical protein